MTNALPEPLDVIAVGAHPDDVEIGCGGILAVLASQGYRVGIVDLTDGEPTPGSSGPAERLAEAAAAAKLLGVVHRETLPFANRRLFDSFEVRVAVATIFRRWRPRLVLGLADKTPLASPDHAPGRGDYRGGGLLLEADQVGRDICPSAGAHRAAVSHLLSLRRRAEPAARPPSAGGRHRRAPRDEARGDRLLRQSVSTREGPCLSAGAGDGRDGGAPGGLCGR